MLIYVDLSLQNKKEQRQVSIGRTYVFFSNSSVVSNHQAALAKQAKLAALRKWTHIDPNVEEVRLELEDKILNGLLTFDLASRQMSPMNAQPNLDINGRKSQAKASGEPEVDSGDESDLAPQVEELLQRVRRPLTKAVDDIAAAELSAAAASAKDSAGESMLGSDEWPASDVDAEDGGVPDSADESDLTTENHDGPTSPGQDHELPVEGADNVRFDNGEGEGNSVIDDGLTGKTYDLNDIARAGQAGKIMFIFQKVSNGNKMEKSAA